MAKKTLVAQYDPSEYQPMPNQSPEDMMGFPEPDIEGDPMGVEAPVRRPMPIASEPIPFNTMPPINPNNGVPSSITDMMQSPQQQFLKIIQSPEYKAKLKELSDRSKSSIDQQEKGVNENAQGIENLQGLKRTDLSPLLALTDTWTGSDLQKGYQKPQSPEDYQMKVLGLKNQLQSQRKGLSDEQLSLLKSQLTGDMSPMKQLKDMAMMDAYGGKTQAAQMERQQTRQDFQEHQNVLKSIDQDKTNTQRLANYSNLSSALTNFTNATVRSPNQLAELEQTIRNSLGTKGPGGVDERDQTYLKTLERSIIQARQYWSSNPADVKGIQSTIDHLKELAANEQGNFRNQVSTRWKALVGGHESLYERNPHLAEDLQNKINAASSQFAAPTIIERPRNAQGKAIKQKPTPKPSAGQAVDANLDQMTPEELQHWIDTHGQ